MRTPSPRKVDPSPTTSGNAGAMCPEDEQTSPPGDPSPTRFGVTLTCRDPDNPHGPTKKIWTSSGLNRTPEVEIHCPCSPFSAQSPCILGDNNKGFGSFVKRLTDAEAEIVCAATQLVSLKDILKDAKSSTVNKQRVARQRGILLQKMEDFRQINKAVRQRLKQLLDEEMDRIDAGTKIDALLNKILQAEREIEILKGDLVVAEKRAEELMCLQQLEQENMKSALNMAKSSEANRARTQGQLRSKEADNNRLTVQVKVLERAQTQHKAEIEELKASLASLSEQSSKEKEALKKASRAHKQRAERFEAGLDKCYCQLRERDVQLTLLQQEKETWKREKEQLSKGNHKVGAHVGFLQSRQANGLPVDLQVDTGREKIDNEKMMIIEVSKEREKERKMELELLKEGKKEIKEWDWHKEMESEAERTEIAVLNESEEDIKEMEILKEIKEDRKRMILEEERKIEEERKRMKILEEERKKIEEDRKRMKIVEEERKIEEDRKRMKIVEEERKIEEEDIKEMEILKEIKEDRKRMILEEERKIEEERKRMKILEEERKKIEEDRKRMEIVEEEMEIEEDRKRMTIVEEERKEMEWHKERETRKEEQDKVCGINVVMVQQQQQPSTSDATHKASFAQQEKQLAECSAALGKEKNASREKNNTIQQYQNRVAELEMDLNNTKIQCKNLLQEIEILKAGQGEKNDEVRQELQGGVEQLQHIPDTTRVAEVKLLDCKEKLQRCEMKCSGQSETIRQLQLKVETQENMVRSAVERRESAEEAMAKLQERVDAVQRRKYSLRCV
ncbi:outer dense fiber protein 2-like isoform X7 [Entelurus aequoreus]|uniref:outer dense fiber protein 2-like isoform X7 n=1 Tax=Entelurus aequoreus TaxID=161455 RepID=UPI002B1D9A6B|nr:outer dense fiber protein 2-like isoform X7 [Entelurus aequoreus]